MSLSGAVHELIRPSALPHCRGLPCQSGLEGEPLSTPRLPPEALRFALAAAPVHSMGSHSLPYCEIPSMRWGRRMARTFSRDTSPDIDCPVGTDTLSTLADSWAVPVALASKTTARPRGSLNISLRVSGISSPGCSTCSAVGGTSPRGGGVRTHSESSQPHSRGVAAGSGSGRTGIPDA
eukprot:scaffold221131_cov31-Tisochrysis_lutea.AAC.2